MNTNTKKAVIDCLINQDANKLSNRLAHLIPDDIIDILANDVIVVDIISKPEFDNVQELRSFANDYNKELTADAITCAENNGKLSNCDIRFDVNTQQIDIRYEYCWTTGNGNHKDYDYLYIEANLLLNDKRFEFKTI